MSVDYEKIGIRISKRRKDLKIKQKDLAEAVHISSKYLSNIETGKKRASLDVISDICEALNTTPDYLLLGHIKRNYAENITDSLILCSKEDQEAIACLVAFCAERNADKKK